MIFHDAESPVEVTAVLDALARATLRRRPFRGPRPPDVVIWAEADGAPMASLRVSLRDVRTVSDRARAAILEDLSVVPEQWGRGVAAALVERAVELGERRGATLAIGLELPVAPETWRAAPILPEASLLVSAARVRAHTTGGEPRLLRAARPEHRPALARIHAECTGARVGGIARAPSDEPRADVVLVGERGYVAYDEGRTAIEVREIEALDAGFYAAAMRALADAAARRELADIRAAIPLDHPFARFARLFGATHRIRYRAGGFADACALGSSQGSPGEVAQRRLGFESDPRA